MQLHRDLGISYNAAWRLKHKLMQVMMERDRDQPLDGLVQLDDAYLGGGGGGTQWGQAGRGAAVQTHDQGHPLRMKLSVVKGFQHQEISNWATRHLRPGTEVVSDGLACFNAVGIAGCAHSKVITGGGLASVEQPEFHWVNPMLGNVKSALRGTYQAIRPKCAQRYLAEFEYRFNRRFDLSGLIPRLAYVVVRTPPLPERLLKVGLA